MHVSGNYANGGRTGVVRDESRKEKGHVQVEHQGGLPESGDKCTGPAGIGKN